MFIMKAIFVRYEYMTEGQRRDRKAPADSARVETYYQFYNVTINEINPELYWTFIDPPC